MYARICVCNYARVKLRPLIWLNIYLAERFGMLLRELFHVRAKDYGQIEVERWKPYASYVNCGKAVRTLALFIDYC